MVTPQNLCRHNCRPNQSHCQSVAGLVLPLDIKRAISSVQLSITILSCTSSKIRDYQWQIQIRCSFWITVGNLVGKSYTLFLPPTIHDLDSDIIPDISSSDYLDNKLILSQVLVLHPPLPVLMNVNACLHVRSSNFPWFRGPSFSLFVERNVMHADKTPAHSCLPKTVFIPLCREKKWI